MQQQAPQGQFARLVERQRYWNRVVTVAGITAGGLSGLTLLSLLWVPRTLAFAMGVPLVAVCIGVLAWAHHRTVRCQESVQDHLAQTQQAVNLSMLRLLEPLSRVYGRRD